MTDATRISTKHDAAREIRSAVGADGTSVGLAEYLFTLAFSGLVYPQIWEDPVADMEALALRPDHHLVTIASGGCNVLSYLRDRPAKITAVDLNPAHIALTRLKLAAATYLPDYEDFLRFFARPNRPENLAAFESHLLDRLDGDTLRYWQGRRFGHRRIEMFAGNFYAHGLLGHFIGAAHLIARLYGVDPRGMLQARSRDELHRVFDEVIGPLFDRKLLRWLTSRTISLYGLGIPPAQYAALAGGRHMADVLRERLRRLACDFDIQDNYFAHQAFARRYGEGPEAALPPYLQRDNFDAVRESAERVSVINRSMTALLADLPAESVDRVVLLDAQDWMDDGQLNQLWSQVTRTARPGARVIFRTAAAPDLLPGRVAQETLARWDYDPVQSAECHRLDRSGIYGGFHLYRLREHGS